MKPETPTQAPTNPSDTVQEGAETTGKLLGREASAFAPVGYDVGEVLGRGGMGEVVVARDRAIGRDVAIKRMRSANPDPYEVERFLREAKIQARLDHPAIVPVHELGRDAEGRPYFTMKRLAGTTLYEVLVAKAPLQRLLRAFVDVCLAVDFAHARGVVHRDLKPSNIMLGDYGEVYILDWGVARVIGDRESLPELPVAQPGTETQAGDLLGTPGYMAPEQIDHRAEIGLPADIYALGAILFEILAGEVLHPQPDALEHTLSIPTVSPTTRAPDRGIAPELDIACAAALAAEPGSRPTARALADRVQSYLDGDRDVAQRRTLASQHLAIAQAAIASGDPGRRVLALRAANHALALDPESTGAATTVMSLVLEPPRELPPALQQHLREDDLEIMDKQASAGMLAISTPLMFWPVAIYFGVTNYPLMIFGSAVILAMMYFTWREARTRRPTVIPWLIGPALLVACFSRIFGPWIVVSTLAGGLAMTLLSAPLLGERPRLILASLVLGYVTPIVLEATGIIARTWEMTGSKVVTWSAAIDLHGDLAIGFLALVNVVAFVVVGLFARSLTEARRASHRRAEIQRWHLAQLVPSAP